MTFVISTRPNVLKAAIVLLGTAASAGCCLGGYEVKHGQWKPATSSPPSVSVAVAQTKCSGNMRKDDYGRCMRGYGFTRSARPGCKAVSFF